MHESDSHLLLLPSSPLDKRRQPLKPFTKIHNRLWLEAMSEGLQMARPGLFLFLRFFLLRSDAGKYALSSAVRHPLPLPPPPPHLCSCSPASGPLNDRRHLALWTWREPVQDEMEAYFGKPTKALKCKPPAACLAADVFVLVERAAVAYHPGTWQKKRAMCGLLIFKPPVCQVSAVGMRPHIHTHARACARSLSHNPSLSVSLPHGLRPGERSYKLWSGNFFVYDLFGY